MNLETQRHRDTEGKKRYLEASEGLEFNPLNLIFEDIYLLGDWTSNRAGSGATFIIEVQSPVNPILMEISVRALNSNDVEQVRALNSNDAIISFFLSASVSLCLSSQKDIIWII